MLYAKAIAAGVGAAVMALVAVLTDGTVTPVEWATVGVAALGAVGVWNAANLPTSAPFAKAIAAALSAGGVLVIVLPDGVSSAEWAQVAVAVLAVFAVFGVRNRDTAGGL